MEKRKIKAEFALNDICAKYPNIKKKDIEAFGPVYYPIARIEADMQERTFEDFEAVQEAVLRFVNLGFNDESIISNLMGLTADYVRDMLKLLTSYGHIDSNRNVTALGKASIEQGQKITVANTKQVFLLDALNCNIVRIDRDLDRTMIERTEDIDDYDKNIAFLEHSAGISKEEIEKTLRESQYSTLKRMTGGMNINVMQVSDVRCLGIRYIKSYLLKMKNLAPVIFVKRFDYEGRGAERFYWLPFSVPSQKEREFFELPSIEVHSVQTDAMIKDAYARMLDKGKSEWVEKAITRKIEFFTESHFKVNTNKEASPIVVNAKEFFEYSNNVLRFLYSFSKEGLYALVDDDISGNIIFIYPEKGDKLLEECAGYVQKAMDKHPQDKIASYIEPRIEKDGNVIENLLGILKKLID